MVSESVVPLLKKNSSCCSRRSPKWDVRGASLIQLPDASFTKTAFATGLRAGELQDLKVEDIAEDGSFIRIRASVAKNAKAMTQPVSDRASGYLKNIIKGRKPDELVFPKVGRRHGEMLKKDMEDAGIPVHDGEDAIETCTRFESPMRHRTAASRA